MIPRIELSEERKLVGHHLEVSYAQYSVAELWRKFLPRRREVKATITDDLISMAVYPPRFYDHFQPANRFIKWAAVQVSDFHNVPLGMDSFELPAGLYAVFDYKGLSTDHSIFDYILRIWLPASDYTLDDRPHFEILGDKYQNNDPNSEEQIWIPIRSQVV